MLLIFSILTWEVWRTYLAAYDSSVDIAYLRGFSVSGLRGLTLRTVIPSQHRLQRGGVGEEIETERGDPHTQIFENVIFLFHMEIICD